jgi:hypothetical protein
MTARPNNYKGAGGLLVDLMGAQIRDDIQTLQGEVLTRPALLATDGTNLTYACDVRIQGMDLPLQNVRIAAGNRELIYADVQSAVTLTRTPEGRLCQAETRDPSARAGPSGHLRGRAGAADWLLR